MICPNASHGAHSSQPTLGVPTSQQWIGMVECFALKSSQATVRPRSYLFFHVAKLLESLRTRREAPHKASQEGTQLKFFVVLRLS